MTNAKILVVDDSKLAQRIVEYHLSDAGYDISLVSSGQSALQRVDEVNPDVLLLDVVMPSMDGYAVCRALRQNPKWQHLQIILLTASHENENVLKGLEAGADEFLPKPINGDVLRAYVSTAVRRKRKFDHLQTLLAQREKLAAMIVHDMRNPISAMQLNSQLLQRKMADSAERKYLDRIQSQTRYLQGFTNDLLTLAQAESDALRLECHPLDLLDLIRTVVDEYQPAATMRNISLQVELPHSLPAVEADATLMRRVLENLVQNALKFSPAQSTVTISAEFNPTTAKVNLYVTDEGHGVAPDCRKRIFEQYEISSLKKEGVHQTGLGLAFCKMVVQQHGGRISVTDNPNSRGARFVVTL